ncbi:MAG: AmmeMemoRadiSam system protein A [Desulfomonile tiedjei]|nr:AmmeMemoRadiSam system protein A [Desulfomonile tiedjei]
MSSTKQNVGVDLGLTDDEKAELLQIARAAIVSRAAGREASSVSSASARLADKRGAFVCIKQRGMLRGCVGMLESEHPLSKTVAEMAQAAAFRDSRFRAVTDEEIPYLDLEISVLTPLTEIADPEEIQVGVHGLFIRKGHYSGVLLPQVAAERDWDRVTFLSETCRKAGLHPDAWKEKDTKIYVFSADVF